MDVDVDNFEASMAEMQRHLPKSAFVSVDLEMTGITGPAETQVASGDLPQEQYSKARAVVNRPYNIVQVGLCLFEEKASGQFDCRPFNFYVFPKAVDERDAGGKQVKCDPFLGLSASTMEFLAKNGLDFQRWITKGVSYTTATVEAALRAAMPTPGDQGQSRHKDDGKDPIKLEKPQDISLVKETMEKVEAFAESGKEEMKLPNVNKYLALALRQRIEKLKLEKHPGLEVVKKPNPSKPNLDERWVVNLTDDGRKEKDKLREHHLMSLIGFRRMWALLKSARKPLVFHNGFFDLLFLVSAFEAPLPVALTEFKALVHTAFPSIFDTKVMAESPNLSGRLGARSALPELAAGLAERTQGERKEQKQPNESVDEKDVSVSFLLPEGFTQYGGTDDNEMPAAGGKPSFHTAGYDAYQTGCIFAYYRATLGEEMAQVFANRIFLMWSSFELQLALVEDRLSQMYNGIVRHVYDIDSSVLGSRGFAELLKPLTQDGKRKVSFRWCGNGRMLLILHGHKDTLPGSSGREACEECLDAMLKFQQVQGRLKFQTLEAHLARTQAVATGNGTGDAGVDVEMVDVAAADAVPLQKAPTAGETAPKGEIAEQVAVEAVNAKGSDTAVAAPEEEEVATGTAFEIGEEPPAKRARL